MEFELEAKNNFFTGERENYLSLKLDLEPLHLPSGAPTAVKGYLPLADLADALRPYLDPLYDASTTEIWAAGRQKMAKP